MDVKGIHKVFNDWLNDLNETENSLLHKSIEGQLLERRKTEQWCNKLDIFIRQEPTEKSEQNVEAIISCTELILRIIKHYPLNDQSHRATNSHVYGLLIHVALKLISSLSFENNIVVLKLLKSIFDLVEEINTLWYEKLMTLLNKEFLNSSLLLNAWMQKFLTLLQFNPSTILSQVSGREALVFLQFMTQIAKVHQHESLVVESALLLLAMALNPSPSTTTAATSPSTTESASACKSILETLCEKQEEAWTHAATLLGEGEGSESGKSILQTVNGIIELVITFMNMPVYNSDVTLISLLCLIVRRIPSVLKLRYTSLEVSLPANSAQCMLSTLMRYKTNGEMIQDICHTIIHLTSFHTFTEDSQVTMDCISHLLELMQIHMQHRDTCLIVLQTIAHFSILEPKDVRQVFVTYTLHDGMETACSIVTHCLSCYVKDKDMVTYLCHVIANLIHSSNASDKDSVALITRQLLAVPHIHEILFYALCSHVYPVTKKKKMKHHHAQAIMEIMRVLSYLFDTTRGSAHHASKFQVPAQTQTQAQSPQDIKEIFLKQKRSLDDKSNQLLQLHALLPHVISTYMSHDTLMLFALTVIAQCINHPLVRTQQVFKTSSMYNALLAALDHYTQKGSITLTTIETTPTLGEPNLIPVTNIVMRITYLVNRLSDVHYPLCSGSFSPHTVPETDWIDYITATDSKGYKPRLQQFRQLFIDKVVKALMNGSVSFQSMSNKDIHLTNEGTELDVQSSKQQQQQQQQQQQEEEAYHILKYILQCILVMLQQKLTRNHTQHASIVDYVLSSHHCQFLLELLQVCIQQQRPLPNEKSMSMIQLIATIISPHLTSSNEHRKRITNSHSHCQLLGKHLVFDYCHAFPTNKTNQQEELKLQTITLLLRINYELCGAKEGFDHLYAANDQYYWRQCVTWLEVYLLHRSIVEELSANLVIWLGRCQARHHVQFATWQTLESILQIFLTYPDPERWASVSYAHHSVVTGRTLHENLDHVLEIFCDNSSSQTELSTIISSSKHWKTNSIEKVLEVIKQMKSTTHGITVSADVSLNALLQILVAKLQHINAECIAHHSMYIYEILQIIHGVIKTKSLESTKKPYVYDYLNIEEAVPSLLETVQSIGWDERMHGRHSIMNKTCSIILWLVSNAWDNHSLGDPTIPPLIQNVVVLGRTLQKLLSIPRVIESTNTLDQINLILTLLGEIHAKQQQTRQPQPLTMKPLEDMPLEFLCPLTKKVMTDPVILTDGNSYERSAIQQWLQTNDRSPCTNEVLADKTIMIPNHALKKAIEDYFNSHNVTDSTEPDRKRVRTVTSEDPSSSSSKI